MISLNSVNFASANPNLANPVKFRRASYGSEAQVLTDIYLEGYQYRDLATSTFLSLKSSVEAFLQANNHFQFLSTTQIQTLRCQV